MTDADHDQGPASRSSSAPSGPRIALYGEFGIENLGTDGTLVAASELLRSRLADARFVALCVDPEKATVVTGLSALPMHPPEAEGAGRIGRALHKLADLPWMCRTLADFDVLVLAGTGLFEDTRQRRAWQTPWSILATVLAARLRRVPVIAFNVGGTTATSSVKALMYRTALRLTAYRSFRDEDSYRAVAGRPPRWGLRGTSSEDVCFGSDYPRPTSSSSDASDPDGSVLRVGVGLLDYRPDLGDPAANDAARRSYEESIGDVVGRLVRRGVRVRLYVGESTDVAMAEAIVASQSSAGVAEDALPSVDHSSDLAEIVESMVGLDALVATRFHNVVCALRAGAPTAAIAYGPKTAVLMESVGLAEFCLPISEFTGARGEALLDAVLARADEVRQRIAAGTSRKAEVLDRQLDELGPLVRALTKRRARR